MATQALSTTLTRSTRPESEQVKPVLLTQYSLRPNSFQRSQWLGTIAIKYSRHSSNLGPVLQKQSSINDTISFSLPTAKPERVASTKRFPKWSSMAIKSFAMGELEARKIKSPNTGTEALLMGILIEGTSSASKYLRANGITLLKVRDEIGKLCGKPDM